MRIDYRRTLPVDYREQSKSRPITIYEPLSLLVQVLFLVISGAIDFPFVLSAT